ncbi:MAG: hypothetical protein QT11_C0001G0934 [archaeon GW2011_AR20]|nr:MAG: hypothetical protein QT11_C0001G0934 [archaeon GW2011_AR20]MBS3160158.1 hypothetical protein [Candidatus Woesearchaeota archaeon]
MIKIKEKKFVDSYNTKFEITSNLQFFNSDKNILKELAKEVAKDEKIRRDKFIGL